MKTTTLRNLVGTASGPIVLVSMFIPPWNVGCWLLAAAIYYGSGMADNDHSGDAGLMVLVAPGIPVAFASWFVNEALLKLEKLTEPQPPV